MSSVLIGPLGRLVEGHVLDVNKKSFVRALKDYDRQLYVKWNPRKLKGHGCWEIRMQPKEKRVVEVVEFAGVTYRRLEFYEVDMVHHVLDCAFLNYDQLRKIKEMDTFANGMSGNFGEKVERWEAQQAEEAKRRAKESQAYLAKQFKKEIGDFKQLVNSGFNPAEIMAHWGKK